jgi:hypothetical protein
MGPFIPPIVPGSSPPTTLPICVKPIDLLVMKFQETYLIPLTVTYETSPTRTAMQVNPDKRRPNFAAFSVTIGASFFPVFLLSINIITVAKMHKTPLKSTKSMLIILNVAEIRKIAARAVENFRPKECDSKNKYPVRNITKIGANSNSFRRVSANITLKVSFH